MLNKKNLKLLVWVSLLFIPDLIWASSIEVSGRVSGNWNVDTVNVVGDIEIKPSEFLQIEEGVTVLFQGAYSFRVRGCLKALGSQEKPILLPFLIPQVFTTTPLLKVAGNRSVSKTWLWMRTRLESTIVILNMERL